MLCEAYIEALMANEDLADHVWQAWDAGEIDDLTAWLWWWQIFQLDSNVFGCYRNGTEL